MVTRKPSGETWESFVDRQIREAHERGDFDHLPGKGKPLPRSERPNDELWWVRRKMKAEQLSYLPPTLRIRKEREVALQQIAVARTEREARDLLALVNGRIRDVNRFPQEGPPSTVMSIDEEDALRRWREAQASEPQEREAG